MSKKCPDVTPKDLCKTCRWKVWQRNGDCKPCPSYQHDGTGYSPEIDKERLAKWKNNTLPVKLPEGFKKDKPETLEDVIRSCQIDIGFHRYTKYKDDKPFDIRNCCNVDIKDLEEKLRTWLLSKIPQENVCPIHFGKHHINCGECVRAFNRNQALADIKRNMGV